MVHISARIVDGLALALVTIIVLILSIGIGTLLVQEGPVPEDSVILSILIIGSILTVTTVICFCLRAWVKEQQ